MTLLFVHYLGDTLPNPVRRDAIDMQVESEGLEDVYRFTARRSAPLPGCTHKACGNCLRYALKWRAHVMRGLESIQLRFSQV